MRLIDYILLAIVAVGVCIAILYMRRRKRSGKGCCGNCAQCNGCGRKE